MAIESKDLLVWVKAMSRGQALPLDASEIYASIAEAEAYASSPIAYAGQTIKVLQDDGKYHEYILQPNSSGYVLEEVSAGAHDHNDIYYTEDEIDSMIAEWVGDTKVAQQIETAIANQDLFSGDYNDLKNKPNIIENSSKDVAIADEAGNIIFKVDKDGTHTTSLTLNGENIETYILTIDYSKLLAFDTTEIVIGGSSSGGGTDNEEVGTSSVLGKAVLGQMVLG